MTQSRATTALVIAGAILSLACTGCRNQEENVTVAPDGTVTVEVKLSGAPAVFDDPLLVPTSPVWQIKERSIDSSGKDPVLTICAVATAPYGSPLPRSFLPTGHPDYELGLQFPGQVTIETKGKLTYYTFRRTYEARRFAAFDFSEVPSLWDHELESRVVDRGLLKASESDREKYLEQLRGNFSYYYWRLYRDALSDLVRSGTIGDTTLQRLATEASRYLDAAITPDLVLSLMQREDKEIEACIDSLGREIDRHFATAAAAGFSRTTVEQFERAYARGRREYEVNETLGSFNYSLNLVMPGTIVATNGVIGPDEPGKVLWAFKGAKLHDADVPLYAVSVVSH